MGGVRDDEDEEEGGEDEEGSELSSKREDSLSTHLPSPSDPIHIHSSPHSSSSRIPLSSSRHSLSSRSTRTPRTLLPLGAHSPSASPIPTPSTTRLHLQHPSLPRVGSSGSLRGSPVLKQLSHSPLDSFDLNAGLGGVGMGGMEAPLSALDPAIPRIQFRLLPLPSPHPHPQPLSPPTPTPSPPLPAVLNGPLLLPASTSVSRVVQYLCRRLNNAGVLAVDVSEEGVELVMEGEVLRGEMTWEEVKGRWKGGDEAGASKMRVFYRRKEGGDGGKKSPSTRENGYAAPHAVEG